MDCLYKSGHRANKNPSDEKKCFVFENRVYHWSDDGTRLTPIHEEKQTGSKDNQISDDSLFPKKKVTFKFPA